MDFGFRTLSSSDHEVLFEHGSQEQATRKSFSNVPTVANVVVANFFKVCVCGPDSVTCTHVLLLYSCNDYIVIDFSTVVKHLVCKGHNTETTKYSLAM